MIIEERLKRLGSRFLSALGVTRKHHVERLQGRLAAVELGLVERRAETKRLHGMVMARDALLERALAELAFRANSLEQLVDMPDAAPMTRWGFAAPLASAGPGDAEPLFRKTFTDRPLISGLSARQALYLESVCLTRLGKHSPPAARHFPAVVSVDIDALGLVMTHQGDSLDMIPDADRAAVARRLNGSYRDQLTTIVGALEAANVVHLDPHETGRNLAVAADGTLSLIDFDIAVVDRQPFSASLTHLYERWAQAGGYRLTHAHLQGVVHRWLAAA